MLFKPLRHDSQEVTLISRGRFLRRLGAIVIAGAICICSWGFSQDNDGHREKMKPFRDSKNRANAVTALKERAQSKRKAAVEMAKKKGFPIRGERGGRHFELVDLNEKGMPVYKVTKNDDAAVSSGANQIRNSGIYQLNGNGWTVGVWDGGSVRTTHREFSGRAVSLDGATVNSHATHVGGTISGAGITARAEGMAPSVSIDSYDWNSDLSEMASRAAASANISGKITISNHSYGFVSGWDSNRYYGRYPDREDERFGEYDSNAQSIDEVCVNAPFYLPFIAAGNDRTDEAPANGATFEYFSGGQWVSKTYVEGTDPFSDGYDGGGFDTIEGYGVAKNVVTIGAVDDAIAGSTRVPTNGAMASFSSWGPTDDGRIKPDLVANGVSLYSAESGSDSQYSNKSGTSMATPSAAGSSILLQELYNRELSGEVMRASTLKGLLIHTADDLGNPGPDYSYGWGLINVKEAADAILQHAAVEAANTMVEGTLSTANPEDVYVFDWDGSSAIRVTLCWTDPAGATRSGLDNRASNLINDLDIVLENSDGGSEFPFVLDVLNPADNATKGNNTLDTVEQILISNPGASGSYTLTVNHKGSLSGSQDYSLIITGQTANAGGPAIEVSPAIVNVSAEQGTNAIATSFAVRNSAADTLDYAISEDVDWLSVSTLSGSSIGESDPIGLSFSTAALLPGVYTGEIQVSAAGLSTRTVTVQLSVTATSVTLPDSVELGSTTFSQTGNAAWIGQTTVNQDGEDAAKSGLISDGQSSGFSISQSGPGILTFWWKTDTEENSDQAQFFIDGVEQASASGLTEWTRVSADMKSGAHTFEWRYTKDENGSTGTDAVYVDAIEFVQTLPQISRTPTILYLSTVLGNDAAPENFTVWNSGSDTLNYTITDNVPWMSVNPSSGSSDGPSQTNAVSVDFDTDSLAPGVYNGIITIEGGADITTEVITVQLTVTGGGPGIGDSVEFATTWTQGGNADWFGQSAETVDGVDAAQSGDIEDDEESYFETTIEGPGTFSWWWKVDSESGYDFLHFDFNGNSVASISGTEDWIEQIANIGAGTHTVTFRYAKDETVSRNSDTGWIDLVTWTPGTVAMELSTASLSTTVAAGEEADPNTFTVRNSGDGGVLHYQISDNAAWLSVTPNDETSGGEADTITVNYDTSNLSSGIYNGTITVAGAGVSSQSIGVTLTVSDAVVTPITPTSASPYLQDFSGTNPVSAANGWTSFSTNTGRIQIIDGALRMDDSVNRRGFSYNEAVLHANLLGRTGVTLSFKHRNWGDEEHSLANSFVGSVAGDGVSISADGTTWHVVDPLNVVDTEFRTIEIDLDEAIAAAGIGYSANFQIKFQQYDDWAVSSDGFDFDDIQIVIDQLGPASELTASDGIFTNRIALSWTGSNGANQYRLLRNSSNNYETATEIAVTAATIFDDITAEDGSFYFYWVQAENGNETAALSSSDSGYRSLIDPTNISASDGDSTSEIEITWDEISGATDYILYRNTIDDLNSAIVFDTVQTNSATDVTAGSATLYYYWIRAVSEAQLTAASMSDSGFRGLETPQNLTATIDQPDRIELAWEGIAGANSYSVFRSETNNSATATLIASNLSDINHTDFATPTGVSNFYWVVGVSQAIGTSPFSAGVVGQRLEADIDRSLTTPGDVLIGPDDSEVNYDSTRSGKYWGLLRRDNLNDSDTIEIAGVTSLSVSHSSKSNTGAATIVIVYEGIRYSTKGTVDQTGELTRVFTKKGETKSLMTFTAQMVETADGMKLVGTISGDGATTHVDLFKRVFHSKNNPTPNKGRYTFAMPADEFTDSATTPGGDGAAYGTLGGNGTAKLRLLLGDGTRSTVTALASADSQLAFYRSLYSKTATGWISGTLTFREKLNISDADGLLHWKRGPLSSSTRYANGFEVTQPIIASAYTVPNSRSRERILSALSDSEFNTLFNLSGGNTPAISHKFVTWSNRNKISYASENSYEKLSITVTASNGYTRGRYRNSETGQDLRFYGAAIQDQGLAVGNFIGNGETGSFAMDSASQPNLVVSRSTTEAELTNTGTIDFGDVGFEGGFSEIGVTIKNSGEGNLFLFEGPHLETEDEETEDDFVLITTRGGYIPPGGSTVVRIRFEPQTAGNQSASVTILSNDSTNNPFVINLSGTGINGNSGSGVEILGDNHLTSPTDAVDITSASSTEFDEATFKGTYEGLIFGTGAGKRSAGLFVGKITRTVMSATIYIDSTRCTVRGNFNESGFLETNFNSFVLSLQTAMTSSGQAQLIGEITNLETSEQFQLSAIQYVFNSKTNPAPQSGRYTVILPANDNLGDGYPGGDGVGALSVSTGGLAKSTVYLADGMRATWSRRVSGDGQINIFSFLDKSSPLRSSISGVLSFRDSGVSDLDGNLHWSREPNSKASVYPSGFELRQPLIGSVFVRPATNERALTGFTSETENADFFLDGKGLNDTKSVNWSNRNSTSYSPIAAERLSIRINTVSGLFTGYWWDRGNTEARVNFRGALFQKQEIGSGYFYFYNSETGLVQLAPK